MSGICSAHQEHKVGCPLCETLPIQASHQKGFDIVKLYSAAIDIGAQDGLACSIADAIETARKDEREACAHVVEKYTRFDAALQGVLPPEEYFSWQLAKYIRGRV